MSDPSALAKNGRARRRLLLVDDNGEGRRALARLLELYGFEVTAVDSGQAALDALGEGLAPDVVLTDLLLPDLNGREVARRARDLVPGSTVALITGWDEAPELTGAPGSGIDHVFLKPLNVGEVVAQIDRGRGLAG